MNYESIPEYILQIIYKEFVLEQRKIEIENEIKRLLKNYEFKKVFRTNDSSQIISISPDFTKLAVGRWIGIFIDEYYVYILKIPKELQGFQGIQKLKEINPYKILEWERACNSTKNSFADFGCYRGIPDIFWTKYNCIIKHWDICSDSESSESELSDYPEGPEVYSIELYPTEGYTILNF